MPGSPAPAATNPPRAEDHRVRPSASTRSLSALSRTTNGPMRHVPAASLLTCNAADAAPAGHPATATSGGGADRAAAGTTATRATQITPALPAACAATQSRRRTADGVLMGTPSIIRTAGRHAGGAVPTTSRSPVATAAAGSTTTYRPAARAQSGARPRVRFKTNSPRGGPRRAAVFPGGTGTDPVLGLARRARAGPPP